MTTATLDPQFAHDVFVTAVEGGINYWAAVLRYRWMASDGACDLEGFHALVVDAESDESDEPQRIDRDVIVRGLQRIVDGTATCCGRPLDALFTDRIASAVAEIDAGDIDAGDADTIVQVGLFGEVVYG
jgi:hypothetical protein